MLKWGKMFGPLSPWSICLIIVNMSVLNIINLLKPRIFFSSFQLLPFSPFQQLPVLWSSSQHLTLLAWGLMHMESPAAFFHLTVGSFTEGGWCMLRFMLSDSYSPFGQEPQPPRRNQSFNEDMILYWLSPLTSANFCLLEHTIKLEAQLRGTEARSLHGGRVFCS